MGGTSGVLCRYYLHGACKLGADCAFSHNLDDAESQVCRFYQRGECTYGDRCRYQHIKPEWGGRKQEAGPSPGYTPQVVRRPAADDLSEQLPISRLRLGGQAPDAASAAAAGSSSSSSSSKLVLATACKVPVPLPLPLPVPVLPLDPFGSAAGTGDASGAADAVAGTANAVDEWQQRAEEDADAGQYGGQYWLQEGYEEAAGGGQYHWYQGEGEEGYQGEYYGEEEVGWQEGQAGEEQHGAAGDGSGDGDTQAAAWSLPAGGGDAEQWQGAGHPSLRSLCMQWFSTGACNKGSGCKLLHGELCQHCHKHALHPSDSAAREQHLAECRLRHERLEARARSAAVECGICLEAVLAKTAPGERKFGLLTGCDHPFCLSCIRSWRQKTDAGADIDTALRTCPVCRTTSHYIVPSLVWPTSIEEKEGVVAGYKAKLSLVDCRYFNFGDSSCPFGTSCFYRHAYHDGRLEDKTLRKAADEEGNITVMQPAIGGATGKVAALQHKFSDSIALQPRPSHAAVAKMAATRPPLLLVAAVLLTLAAAPGLAQQVGSSIQPVDIEEEGDYAGTVESGSPTPVFDVSLPQNASTTELSVTAAAGSSGSPALYCSLLGNSTVSSNDDVPSVDNPSTDYRGEQRVLPPSVAISADDYGNSTVVRCAVYNRGPSSSPLAFTFSVKFAQTPISTQAEQDAAVAIYDSCCHDDPEHCPTWRENEEAYSGNLCALSMNVCNEAGQLLQLNMRGYNLTCEFPLAPLLNFTELQHLNLADNPALTGSFSAIADSLADLDFLEELVLDGSTGVTGPLSAGGQDDGACLLAQKLRALSLNDMKLNGTVPDCMFGSTAVLDLRASNNQLSGTLPPFVFTSPLRVLLLNKNALQGALPESWFSPPDLTFLNLSSNNLTGTLYPTLVDGTTRAGSFPANLTRLDLSSNSLSGSFFGREWFEGPARLEEVNVAGNQLTELPSSLDSPGVTTGSVLSPISSLNLANNQLQGVFPAGFGDFGTLQQLVVSSNKLNGTLPALGSDANGDPAFGGVVVLDADFNQFSGSIPDSWAQIGAVSPNATTSAAQARLNLQNNSLTGVLPQFLARSSISSLTPVPTVNLTGNSFDSAACDEFAYSGATCTGTTTPPSVAPAPAEAPSPSSSTPPASPALDDPPPPPSPSPPPPPPGNTTTADKDGDGGSSLSSGAVAGVVIAVLLVSAAALGAIYYHRRRRHLQRGANPLSTNRFERFDDPQGPQDTAGSWGMPAPSPVQQPGWDAYQQQASGVQLTNRRSFDP
ncbi:hypothetical protein D9Q98_005723 [Chlorella vulgaris]|uniref:RING-type E3 ubiquitin transferase n=1 Tax=Chlorella vulgaris TaxID=3077 RepID=A0A9D4YW50_CHLVU|nr:hypothetical protein D9Q98_005723 [Chlorella vulgaris]